MLGFIVISSFSSLHVSFVLCSLFYYLIQVDWCCTSVRYTEHLLWEDFDGGYVAFHVKHLWTVVAAQQITTVDTNGTPVFIRVIFLPAWIGCHPVPFSLCPFVQVTIRELRARGGGGAAVLRGRRGSGGQSGTRRGGGGGAGAI